MCGGGKEVEERGLVEEGRVGRWLGEAGGWK